MNLLNSDMFELNTYYLYNISDANDDDAMFRPM